MKSAFYVSASRLRAFLIALIATLGLTLFPPDAGAQQVRSAYTVGTPAKIVVTTGTPEEARVVRGLYDTYPDLRPQILELRKYLAAQPYNTKVEISLYATPGGAMQINWAEVAAGAAAGLAAALIWNAFGGEILCAMGFVPFCACVGPQC